MDYCLVHIRKAVDKYRTTDNVMHHAVNIAWFAFDKYYNLIDESGAYAAAILLHPNRRKAYLQTIWKKNWILAGVDCAKKLWDRYNQDDSSSDGQQAEELVLNDFEQWQADTKAKQHAGKLQDEFNRFINAPAEDVITATTSVLH